MGMDDLREPDILVKVPQVFSIAEDLGFISLNLSDFVGIISNPKPYAINQDFSFFASQPISVTFPPKPPSMLSNPFFFDDSNASLGGLFALRSDYRPFKEILAGFSFELFKESFKDPPTSIKIPSLEHPRLTSPTATENPSNAQEDFSEGMIDCIRNLEEDLILLETLPTSSKSKTTLGRRMFTRQLKRQLEVDEVWFFSVGCTNQG